MIILKAILVLVAIPAIFFIAILAAIFINSPKSREKLAPENGEGLDFTQAQSENLTNLAPLQTIKSANGSPINFRFYKNNSPSKRLIVLIHGSGWHSMQYEKMANFLTSNNLGHVVTPDLRGHGENPERRGDVDYIGQMEDDIADLIKEMKKKYLVSQIIVAGHSSGGGLAIRLAGGTHGKIADGWILLSPYLNHDAPTLRKNAGGWAHPLIARTIGLSILNPFGFTALNHLTSIQFNMPKAVLESQLGHTATTAYSFRLNTSFSPRSNYGKDIAQINKPMLLLVGSEDEAFIAEKFEPTLSAYTDQGTYKFIDGVTHINLTSNPKAFNQIAQWLKRFD